MCVGGMSVAAVLQRGAYAVAALAHSGIGQANGVKVILVGLDAGTIDLHLNNVGVDAVDRGAEGLVEHGAPGETVLRSVPPSAHQGLIPDLARVRVRD